MWYFVWIFGIGLVLVFGIINVMWLEVNYVFGCCKVEEIYECFVSVCVVEK